MGPPRLSDFTVAGVFLAWLLLCLENKPLSGRSTCGDVPLLCPP